MASQAWMWLAAENKVDMVLLWEDWEWWFIPSFCTKQLQQNLRFTFSRNHPPTKRTYRETSLSWEDIISFPMSKLNFLLLWSLKWIKLTLKFNFLLIKRLYFKSIMWSVWLSIVIIKTNLIIVISNTSIAEYRLFIECGDAGRRLPWEVALGN